MMKYFFPLLVLLAELAPSAGVAGLIGEPAPPIILREWMRGKPVEIQPGTNIFVVEIWETGDTNSIKTLDAVQSRFKTNGVVVIAVSDETPATITDFLKREGTNIQFSIVADNKRHTGMSYMKPEGMRTIPYAFIVGTNGHLLWHGPPLPEMSLTLQEMIGGRYDEEVAKKVDVARRQIGQYLLLARQGNEQTKDAGQRILAARTNDMQLLCDLAFQIATYPKLATRDFALASEAVNQAEKLSPTNVVPVGLTQAIVLFESGKQEEGLARATQALATAQSSLDKTNIQASIRVMERRSKTLKSKETNASKPGNVNDADHVSAASTNQSKATDPAPAGSSGKP